jgi:hypothetical protein
LGKAFFLGNAPSSFGSNVFSGSSLDFSIYYWSGNAGFTTPTWQGYSCQMYGGLPNPVSSWLANHGLFIDTDLTQDLNGDGVTLLEAYALNLEPFEDLSNVLPSIVTSPNGPPSVEMTFYGAREDVFYYVETSEDLISWTTNGAFITEPDLDGLRTASMNADLPSRFMRLRYEVQ